MGASASKTEEDKALQLCRERKKFVRQALDGRCALAAAHVAYIQSLKSTGTALRKFVLPEAPVESSLYTSTSATPVPVAMTEESLSQLFYSPCRSPPTSSQFHVNRMRFRGSFAKKIEESPPAVVTETITSLSTLQNVTSPHAQEGSPWDYFGVFHPADNHLSSYQEREMIDNFENDDNAERVRQYEGMPELGGEEDKESSDGDKGSQESEDEFDDPSSETFVRSFENLSKGMSHVPLSASPTVLTASATPEDGLLKGEKLNSPNLSPLGAKSFEASTSNDAKMTEVQEDDVEHKVAPKDFFLSMRDVEQLFTNASESGKEVPRMLEANKLHFRPIIPGQQNGSTMSMLFKDCFSCGEDPSQFQEEPTHTTTKYLTWHRTTSSRSSSSRNLLVANSRDNIEDLNSNLFESSCMISGSHASTLDRLYAWERKLYDEVKASQIVRKQYDMKCEILRGQELRDESSQKIDKTRAAVKDLHSRIRVIIHRIHSISKRIEELRDRELEPQLEELTEGLCRMWGEMFHCHKLQLHIMTIAYSTRSAKISVHCEPHRDFTVVLENELQNLSSSFSRWITAQKSYVQAIDNWLHKCVALPQTTSKRKRRPALPPLRRLGPPIYTTCGVWLEMLGSLPVREVVETVKDLAANTSRFLPVLDGAANDDVAFEDSSTGYDHFRSSLVIFLSQLSSFGESSVKMYTELQESIREAKRNYEHLMSKS